MKPVVRLQGDDADVRAVAREAVAVLHSGGADAQLFGRFRSLNDRRRRLVAAAQASESPAVQAASVSPKGPEGGAYRVLWATLLTIGLTAALTAAVMLGPAGRKNTFVSADLAVSVAIPAAAVAIAVLLIALLLRVPDARNAAGAETMVILVGVPVLGILVFRVITGVSDERGFASETLLWWIPAMVVISLLLIGIAVRSDGARREGGRRSVPKRGVASSSVDRNELRRTAESLATSPTTRAIREDWSARLTALAGRSIPPETIAQARTMTPTAWLAWLCYDGEIDVSGVIPRR